MQTRSPSFSYSVGVWAIPTPCRVPVRITVSGRKVVEPLKKEMSAGTSKIISMELQFCITFPFTMDLMFSVLESGISSCVEVTKYFHLLAGSCLTT